MAKITDALLSAFVKATVTKPKKPSETYAYGIARNAGDKSIEVQLDGSDTWIKMKSAVKVQTYQQEGTYDKVAVMIKNRTGLVTSNLSTPTLNTGTSSPVRLSSSGGSTNPGEGQLVAQEELTPFDGAGSDWYRSGRYAELYTDDDYTDIYVGRRNITYLYVYGVSTKTINQVSDERLKTDIFDTDESNALGKINLIKHRKYKWKSDGSEVSLGYIAQEMGEIDPELEIKHGTCSVNMSYLIPLMSKAIQELSAEVRELREEVRRLSEEEEQEFNEEVENLCEDVQDIDEETEELNEEAQDVGEEVEDLRKEVTELGETQNSSVPSDEEQVL